MTDKKTGDSQDVREDLDRDSKNNTVRQNGELRNRFGFQPTSELGTQYYQEGRRYAPRRQHSLNEGPAPRGRPRE